MWISKQLRHPDRPAPRGRALDTFGLVVALAFLPEFVGARAGVVLQPHPGWIAAAGAVGIGSAVAGSGLVASWSRLDSGPNLIAFGACLAVSGIASLHL